MNFQQHGWSQKFFLRTSGALVFIALAARPDEYVYSSPSTAFRAWMVRLGWAAAWALLTGIIAPERGEVSSLRITPAPTAPYEGATAINTTFEEVSRVDLRMVVGFALAACIESLLSGKGSLTAPLGSPQSTAAWVEVLIYTAFWGMMGGAFSKKPRVAEGLSRIEQVKDHPPATPVIHRPKSGIDRARWIMFAMFFAACFAISLWAHGGDLRFGGTWTGALEYCGKLLAMSIGMAFFWAPIPAMFSSADPELIRITPAKPEPPSLIY